MKWIVENISAILPESILPDALLLVDDDVIRYVGSRTDLPTEVRDANLPRFNGQGLFLSPGFIDQHVHGGGGADFMDATEEAFRVITETHARYGTTGMLATALSGTADETKLFLDTYRAYSNSAPSGAELLGIHMEGPYFSPTYAGAQDPAYLRLPDAVEYDEWLAAGPDIRRWTIAPELPGALEMSEKLTRLGIQVSAGHTAATCRQMLDAVSSGFNQVTHLYSGMSSVHYINGVRSGGVVEAVYLSDEIQSEIICDGVHLPPELLRLIRKFKNTDSIALVTDAMRAAGQDTRESILGSLKHGRKIIIEDGVAKLPDRSAMAGSIATTNRLVRTWAKATGSSLAEAVRLQSLNPARFNHFDKQKGSLEVGKDADFLLFDPDINVEMTTVRGRPVYLSESLRPAYNLSGIDARLEKRQ